MTNFKDYKTKIKEIVFSDEDEKSFCDIFVYEPENIEEKSLGNLYIVGEVVNLPENSSYIVNLLASIIKKEFYSNKKRSTLESLEASLNKVNSMLSDITEQGNVDWIGNLNMTCAAHCQKELHLSQTGKVKSLLIRNSQITDIGKSISSEGKPNPFKTFSNIASGELEINDLVLLATPGLFSVLSAEKIKQLSESFEFEEFADKIQDLLAKDEESSTIAALLIEIESRKEEAKISQVQAFPMKKTSEEVVRKEIPQPASLQSNTPPIIEKEPMNSEKISLENIIKEFEINEKKPAEIRILPAHQDLVVPETPVEIAPQSRIIPTESAQGGQKISEPERVRKYPLEENHPSTNGPSFPSKIMSALNILGTYAKNAIPKISSHIKMPEIDVTQKLRLMRNSKIVFSAIIFISIVLLGNVVITNYNNQIEAEKQRYVDLLGKSQAKIDEAEWLIINDPEKARISLIDAKTIAIKVRDEHKNLSIESSLLIDKIQIQIDKIDKVFRIDEPSVAMDLSGNDKISNISTLTKFSGNHYTLSRDNSVYKLDLGSGTAEEIKLSVKKTDDAGKAKLATTVSKTGEIVFLTENNKILTFDPEKSELRSENIQLNADLSNITAIASYNSFIYLLEPGTNQVYKHKETADGFGIGTKWMNEKTDFDIRNSASMTIDSTIYILQSNGQIEEYLTGNKIKFSAEELKDPALNPTIIFTETGLKNLYVADPLKNRVIIFDKEKGNLVKQFIVKNFNNSIKDMTADDKEEALFILSGTKIFKLDLASETK